MFGRKKDREEYAEEAIQGILGIKTPKYYESIRFFEALGFEVISSEGDQLCPLFGQQEVSRVILEGWELNLEEDTSIQSAPVFNLHLRRPRSEESLKKAAAFLPDHEVKEGLYGRFYTFFTPDNGSIVFEVSDWMPEILGWRQTKARRD